jgi:acetylornithine deacetylase
LIKPNALLNSHHDTVKPNQGYTNDPFEAIVKMVKLFDWEAMMQVVVWFQATFVHFYSNENLPYNIVMVASAEEESSGKWIKQRIETFTRTECAIVGEPTLMQLVRKRFIGT